ncbi:TPA: Ig-like domain-containing protein, partial [Candidatus Scatousia excrementigallinarum]|nr:Ig-like domain-containing protein [Candidatus Scatousia excrementigallinarum]
MRAFKKTILMYLSIIYALIICVSGLCACNNGNEPQKPDDSAENSYFLQKVEISGNDKIRTGGTTTLSATASARTGAGKLVTSTEGFTYLSSDETIATVNENGIVSGHKEGVCDITVKHEEFNAENKFNLQVVSTVKLDFASGSGINTFGRTQIKDGQLLFVNALSGFEVNFDGTELKGVFNSVT